MNTPSTSFASSQFSTYEQADNEPLLSGYLWKKPSSNSSEKRGNQNWQKRFFVLSRNGVLNHLLDEHSAEARGSVFLQQNTRVLISEYRAFCFELRTPSQRKIVLAANSEEEKDEWFSTLQKACKFAPAREIKLCVVGDDRDLQQKILETFFLDCNQKDLADKVKAGEYLNDNIHIILEVTGEKISLTLCCVASTDYPQLRTLNYHNVNGFILCYAADDKSTLDSLQKTWIPEISKTANASLFIISIQPPQSPPVVDRTVGEELSTYLNAASFFHLNMNLYGNDQQNDKTSDAGSSSRFESVLNQTNNGNTYDQMDSPSPAEMFLSVLEITLEDIDASLIEDSTASGDVGNLSDFRTDSKRNVFGTLTGRMGLLRALFSRKKKKGSAVENLSALDNQSASQTVSSRQDKEMYSTLLKLKAMLRNLRPRQRTRRKNRLGDQMRAKAHFVARNETASLVFLGESFLETEVQDTATYGNVR